MKHIKIFLPLVLILWTVSVYAQETQLKIGDKAPDFSLPGTDGNTYSLKNFSSAKVLVMVFTCNHCPTAQAYEDRIIKFTNDYKNKGVQVVAISPNDPSAIRLDELGYSDLNDSMEEMIIRVKDKGYNFPYLYDGKTQQMSRAYGPAATPHVFIFDKDKKLRYKGRWDNNEKIGAATQHDVIDAVEALLSGKEVAIKETKTFGCSVKWTDKQDFVAKSDEQWAKMPVDLKLIEPETIKSLIKNDSDKFRLINVWATWCGPCVAEFPYFVEINRMYRNRDFEFISVSADNPNQIEKVEKFLKKVYASNTNFLVNEADKYKLIEAIDKDWQGALPYTIFVAPGGKILYSKQGEINPLQLKKLIVEHIGRYYN
jgi:peroxiredoxin